MAASEAAPLSFSRLSQEYIPAVMQIETEAYPDPWTYNMFRQEIYNENSHFYLLFSGNVLAGYGGFWLLLDEIHITRMTIIPALRGRGLAKQLMGYLFDVARKCGAETARLEVRESNRTALRLYESLGFVQEGCRKAYYRHSNEDAIVMARAIEAKTHDGCADETRIKES